MQTTTRVIPDKFICHHICSSVIVSRQRLSKVILKLCSPKRAITSLLAPSLKSLSSSFGFRGCRSEGPLLALWCSRLHSHSIPDPAYLVEEKWNYWTWLSDLLRFLIFVLISFHNVELSSRKGNLNSALFWLFYISLKKQVEPMQSHCLVYAALVAFSNHRPGHCPLRPL